VKTIQFVSAGSGTTGNNIPVAPGMPADIVPGDLVLILASIRNSGTGVPSIPLGWKTLVLYGNVAVFARIAPTGAFSMPTVSFTGGAANSTTIAKAAALRFCAPDIDQLLNGTAVVLNGAAQNIGTPALSVTRDGCLALLIGWKQDDWTGTTPPAGYTEIMARSSTLGDDSAEIMVGQVQTAAANVGAATIVVTGGAAAISRGIALTILPYVTTWTDIATSDAPCDFPAEFNVASEAACAAMTALEASINLLTNPPAARVSATSGAVTSSTIIPFSAVDIDPTGLADLVADPDSVTLSPVGLWMTGHAINAQYSGTEGNDVRVGNGGDFTKTSTARDFNTTNNPPTGGGVACAGALEVSGPYSAYRLSSSVSISGLGAPTDAIVLKATEYMFRVSD